MVSSCGAQKLVAGQIKQRKVFLPVISITVGEEIHKASKKVGLCDENRKIMSRTSVKLFAAPAFQI